MVAGPSCLVAFLLLSIASRAFFPNFNLAFATQLPLTIANDLGLALAVAVCMLVEPRTTRTSRGYAFAICATGACLSTFVKMGILGGASATTLAIGDALAAFFTALCLIMWWKIILEHEACAPQKTIAHVGLVGGALFFPFALLPSSVAGVAAAVVLPAASCLCLAPFLGEAGPIKVEQPQDGTQKSKPATPGIVAAIVVLSFCTADPILDLFPTNLFFDGDAIGSLCLPGAVAAGICAAMSAASLALTQKHDLPLGALYVPAFALAAVGFLLSPYRPINGIPLGCAEGGRILVCAFIMCIVLMVAKNDPRQSFALSLKTALLACFVVLAIDIAIIALQFMPGFDYSDFVFRTTFSIVNIVALVALLLGPLPRLEVSLATMDAKESGNAVAAPQPATDPAAQREQLVANFAQAHGLTTRETEVFALMAAGRDVPYIERELVLAKSTVKTHVKHIYAKCDVSSKQDLLDMLEEFSK